MLSGPYSINQSKFNDGVPSRKFGIVLAGGYGTRIGDLSSNKHNKFPRAKPSLTVGNQPAMLGVLLAMREMGIELVTVASKHQEHTIRQAIGDGAKYGLKIDYFDMDIHKIQNWGTAWTVFRWYQKYPELHNGDYISRTDTIVVMSGDTIWDRSIAPSFIESFGRSQAKAQIAVNECPWTDIFTSYGIVEVGDKSLRQAYREYLAACQAASGDASAIAQARMLYTGAIAQGLAPHRNHALPILNFIEKPEEHDYSFHVSNLGNASIYALLGEIFELYKDHPTDPKRTISHTFADFGYKLFQEGFVQDQIPFEAFITPPNWYWLDIGTPRKLLQANFDIMSGRYKDGTLGHEIRPGIWLGRDVRISEATLAALKPPVVIGDSVIIDGNDSEIGPDVAIGPEWEIHGPVKIKSCVLLGPCYEDRLDHIKILRPGVSVEGSILAGGIIESADPIVNKVVVIDPSSQLRFSDLN